MFQENLKVGDKVIYLGSSQDQVNWGINDDPRGILIEGDTYQIQKIEIHSWHTKISLIGVKGKFNSVSFKKL